MSEIKSIHKVPHSLMSHLARDLTTAERERNMRRETVAQTSEITVAAQKELNCRIDTLTQGTPLLVTTAPPTITITPLPDKDNTPKSVIIISMIEMFLMNDTCDAIPHATITVEIVHCHLMLLRNPDTHLMVESITLFPKKPRKKFSLEFPPKTFRRKTAKAPKGSHTCLTFKR